MRLQRLYLKNFRNYKQQVIDLSDGVNLICGANGQGKTSLLEAIYVLMVGRSFRASRFKELVRMGSDSFHLEAQFLREGVQQRVKVFSDGMERRVIFNQKESQSWVNVLGVIPGVVMTPDDSELIKNSPQGRRRWIDIHLSQKDPLYVQHLVRYHRSLRQRNALLRQRSTATIEVWEEELALSASHLISLRSQAIEELECYAKEAYETIAGEKISLSLRYRTGFSGHHDSSDLEVLHQNFLEQYKKSRDKDLEAGYSQQGPHRDDIIISLDGKEARYYASEGQQRSCVIAMRQAEWKALHKTVDVSPLMMIDDLGASLDHSRRERLLHLLEPVKQIFITSLDKGSSKAFSQAKKIFLHNGSVE